MSAPWFIASWAASFIALSLTRSAETRPVVVMLWSVVWMLAAIYFKLPSRKDDP